MTVVCSHCNHSNPGSPDKCEKCGKLLPLTSGDTLLLDRDEVGAPVQKKKAWTSAEVGESHEVIVHVGEAVRQIKLPAEGKVSLGRRVPGRAQNPDVDLEPHKAAAKGVSRIHAQLRLRDSLVQVQDAGSTNGTFLNEQQVSASEWRIVRHGDELRLGNLVLKVYFENESIF